MAKKNDKKELYAKVCVVGDAAVGKTSILIKYFKKQFI
jgi:GTPase SAR1 family protein